MKKRVLSLMRDPLVILLLCALLALALGWNTAYLLLLVPIVGLTVYRSIQAFLLYVEEKR
jgi:hypothetical protein